MWVLLACARPLPCLSFCERAGEVLAACAEEQGLEFEAMGWASDEDFQESCRTWAWEARRLEERRGEAQERCEAWEEHLTEVAEGGACAAWTALPWGAIGEARAAVKIR